MLIQHNYEKSLLQLNMCYECIFNCELFVTLGSAEPKWVTEYTMIKHKTAKTFQRIKGCYQCAYNCKDLVTLLSAEPTCVFPVELLVNIVLPTVP